MTDGTRSFVDESKGKCLQPSHKRPFLSQPTTTTTRISLYKSRMYIKTALKRGFHVQVSRAKAPEGKIGGDLNTIVAFETPELVQARLVHCARCAPSVREKYFPAAKRCRPAKTGFRQTDDRQHGRGNVLTVSTGEGTFWSNSVPRDVLQHGRGNVLWCYCSLSRAGRFLHSLRTVEMARGEAQAE